MREDWLLKHYSAKGSEAAFAELVRRHLDFVYSVCRRKVGDPELAQDITQTVFLILATKSGSLEPGTVLSGWLFQTAHHACRNALRSEARRRHYERKAAEEMEHSAPFAAAESDLPQAELMLDDALAQLSAADRNAVLLRYVEDMSPEEMGIALGISAAAAQKRVSRALERLRGSLAQVGTGLSVAALGLLLTDKLVQAAPVPASAAILAAVRSGFSAAESGAIGSGAALGQLRLGQITHPAPVIKASVLVAAVLLGGILLTGMLLHRRTARTGGGQAKVVSAPEAIITFNGTVINTNGGPAAGVTVHVLRSAALDGTESLFAEAKTDQGGRYRVSGPGSAQDQWSMTADSGSRLGIGVPGRPCMLLPLTRLRLHFVAVSGQPLTGLGAQPLLLTRTNTAGQPATVSLALGCPKRLIVRSDRFGNATFAGLPQGCSMSFAVLDPDYERRPPEADSLGLAAQADSGTQVVTVLRGASVAGRLVYAEAGLPAAGVRIGAQEAGTAAWGEAQTDAEGRYVIRQLSPGRYTVAVDEESQALDSEWTAAAVPGVTLGPGQSAGADMSLVRGTLITGTVTAQGSHRPVAGTEIGVYGPAHPATGAWVSGGWTGADGTYQVRVPPGAQHVYPMAFPGAAGANITTQTGQTAVVDFAVPAP